MKELTEEYHVENVRGGDNNELAAGVLQLMSNRHKLRLERQRALVRRETRNGIIGAVVLERQVEIRSRRRAGFSGGLILLSVAKQ